MITYKESEFAALTRRIIKSEDRIENGCYIIPSQKTSPNSPAREISNVGIVYVLSNAKQVNEVNADYAGLKLQKLFDSQNITAPDRVIAINDT